MKTQLLVAVAALLLQLTDGRCQSDPPSCPDCEFNETPKTVSWRVTIPSDTVRGQRIRISGTIFQADGKTPAAGAILYAYHTNATGRYAKLGTEDRRSYAWWHGYLRGWLKTDERGRYEINTIRPAPYPSRDTPAHIHATVRAPGTTGGQPINDFVFRDDPLVTDTYWYRTELASGQLRYEGVALKPGANGVLEGKRDIVLHPAFDLNPQRSGLLVGTEAPAFDPTHAWGPDRGTRACPMCKYGSKTTGVVAWLGNHDWGNAGKLAVLLETWLRQRGTQRFRAFLVYTNPQGRPAAEVTKQLEEFSRKNGLRDVAVLHVPSPADKPTSFLYGINPRSANTLLVYHHRRVVENFVNLKATPAGLQNLLKALEARQN